MASRSIWYKYTARRVESLEWLPVVPVNRDETKVVTATVGGMRERRVLT